MRIITALIPFMMFLAAPCLASVNPPVATFVVVDSTADEAQNTIDALRAQVERLEKSSGSPSDKKEIERLKGVIAAKNAVINKAIKAVEENHKLTADLALARKESEALKQGLMRASETRVLPPAAPAPDEMDGLGSLAEQVSAQAKEIAMLKQQLAANFAAAQALGSKVANLSRPVAAGDSQAGYEQAIKSGSEEIFISGLSKARMAKLPGGQVLFKLPLDMAEKTVKLFGAGPQSWFKTKDGIFVVTSNEAVKRN